VTTTEQAHEALGHHYVSTACLHGLCDERCRRTCKFCDEPCRHGCHTGEPVGDLPPAWLDQARRIARRLLTEWPSTALAQEIATDPALFWLHRGEVPPGVWRPPTQEDRP
jgi:hypothetical protein